MNKVKYLWYVLGVVAIAGSIILTRKKAYREAYETEITGSIISILDTRDGVNVEVNDKSITVSLFSIIPSHIKFDEIALTGDTVIKRAKSNVLVLKHSGKDYYYTIIQ